MISISCSGVLIPDLDFFWNACRTYICLPICTAYTTRYASVLKRSAISKTPLPTPLKGFATGALSPFCTSYSADPRLLRTSGGNSLTCLRESPSQIMDRTSSSTTIPHGHRHEKILITLYHASVLKGTEILNPVDKVKWPST